MKKILFTLFAAVLVLCSCSTEKKDLVVYYSQTGNTEAVAKIFAAQTGAELLKLECEVPYPDDYQATIEESRPEIQEGACRPLKNGKIKVDRYNRIYLGYPIWYGTYPPTINTFIAENDLSGKEIVIFCTYGSGGLKGSVANFKKACPGANVVDSFGIAGRRIASAEAEVKDFIANIGKEKAQVVGGFSEFRPIEESEMEIFKKATEGYGYLNLVPKAVATQVVAGINYLFKCDSSMGDGQTGECEVKIFRSVIDEAPYVISVERQ